MSLERARVLELVRSGRVGRPDSNRAIDGAGQEERRARYGTCVKPNSADLVGVSDEQRVDAPVRTVLRWVSAVSSHGGRVLTLGSHRATLLSAPKASTPDRRSQSAAAGCLLPPTLM